MATAVFQFDLQGGQPQPDGWQLFEPGAPLWGRVQVLPDGSLRCNHLWIKLQWHTEGRGDRDEAQVAAIDAFQGTLAANTPRSFDFRFATPASPWSYAGHYINIVWEVVAEIDVPLALDVRAAQPFILAPLRR